MADRVLSNIVAEIVKKMGSAAFQLVYGLETESHKMEDTISAVKAALLDAQQEHATNHQVSDWLEKLKDVVDDADDLLDDFSTEDLRRKATTSNKKAKKVHIFFSSSNQLFFRVKMSRKVKSIRERLDVIAETKIKFHFSVERPIDKQDQIKKREDSHSFVRAEEVIGRDGDKKAIVELLMDYSIQANVSVIAILGIGGLGKTKLAQLVFNDERITKHFELKMWVCVSDVFDVKKVAENIIESATRRKPENLQMEGVQNQLREEIDGKKYLLVLDDVWNENRDRWIELRDLLMGGARGSKILITTRTKLVATVSGANPLYPLKGLSEEESWSLFKQMAFKEENELQNACRVEIGKEIAKKCAGVPLAIRVLGSLLYSKDTMNEWLNFKNKDMAEIAQDENILLPMLQLSYDHLPSHLKQCFVFCRLYPKDHVIDKQQLIQLWCAHGFIRLSDENQDMEDVGDLYFMKLLRMSFFQDDIVDEFGNIISCKMHDLMHDLAQLVAGTESSTVNLDTKAVSPRICHVSFDSSIRLSRKIPAPLLKAIKIRTFLLPAQRENLDSYPVELENSVYGTIVSNFKRLRVLDLHNLGLNTVPSCISKLRHLRYLDVSGNWGIEKLPNYIIKLQNLQTLKLSRCPHLIELPRDIRKLVSLRHLELDDCFGLTDVPCGLGQLTSLKTLKRFIAGRCNRLRELKDLNNLRGELSIELPRGLPRFERPHADEAEEANLEGKEYLQSLKLYFGDYDDGELELVLEALRPHTNMKRLEIEGYGGVRLPTWMSLSSLPNLVEISLWGCKGCKHLPKIQQLPSLKTLVLDDLNSVEYINDNSCGVNEESSSSSPSSSREGAAAAREPTTTFFPSLKYLSLKSMPNLKGWWRSKTAAEEQSTANNQEEKPLLLLPSFPCLVESKIEYCPKLTSMPLQPTIVKLQFREVSEKVVQQQLLMMAKAIPSTPIKTKAALVATSSSSLLPLSNLEELVIFYIDDLVILPEEVFRLLTSLLKLEIYGCAKLTSLSRGMRHLTTLNSLEIRGCEEIDLSDGDDDGMHFQGLRNLTSLDITNIPKLNSLPSGLQHITTLQSLSISNCQNLRSLPEWIGNLISLQHLFIRNCRRFKSLPQGMHRLTALQQLKIELCSQELKDRCQKEIGEDWPKIAHIPEVEIDGILLNLNSF